MQSLKRSYQLLREVFKLVNRTTWKVHRQQVQLAPGNVEKERLEKSHDWEARDLRREGLLESSKLENGNWSGWWQLTAAGVRKCHELFGDSVAGNEESPVSARAQAVQQHACKAEGGPSIV